MTGFFVRLGAIAASTAWIFGLVELARFAGWPVGLGAGLGGVILSVVLTEDWERSPAAGADRTRWPHRPRMPRKPAPYVEDA